MLNTRNLSVAIALIALTTPAFAQDTIDLAKAKAEGKVVWYTSTPLPQAQKIVNLFEKEYGIKVELFRSGGSAILRRFQQEADAGRIGLGAVTRFVDAREVDERSAADRRFARLGRAGRDTADSAGDGEGSGQ